MVWGLQMLRPSQAHLLTHCSCVPRQWTPPACRWAAAALLLPTHCRPAGPSRLFPARQRPLAAQVLLLRLCQTPRPAGRRRCICRLRVLQFQTIRILDRKFPKPPLWRGCSAEQAVYPAAWCSHAATAARNATNSKCTGRPTLPRRRDSGCTTSDQPPSGRVGGRVMRLCRRIPGASYAKVECNQLSEAQQAGTVGL